MNNQQQKKPLKTKTQKQGKKEVGISLKAGIKAGSSFGGFVQGG